MAEFERLMKEHRARPTMLMPLWNVAGFALGRLVIVLLTLWNVAGFALGRLVIVLLTRWNVAGFALGRLVRLYSCHYRT